MSSYGRHRKAERADGDVEREIEQKDEIELRAE
jgi:hypothetical protein